MRPIKFALAGALALAMAGQLRADVQARVNVLAQALAAAPDVTVRTIVVSGFIDSSTGQRPPFARALEADLRKALKDAGASWRVVGGKAAATADALLTGGFVRSGPDILVHVELRAQDDGSLLWQRNTFLVGSDVPLADLPMGAVPDAAAQGNAIPGGAGPGGMVEPDSGDLDAGDQGDIIPRLPYRERRRSFDDFWGMKVDFSLAYKAFFSTNSDFRSVAGGRQDALSLGMDFDDIVLWDMDFWSQSVNNLGTAQSLDYGGTDLAVVYPLHLGRHWTLYAGPGGRFGEISVNDPALYNYGVAFGNDALTAVAGAKWVDGGMGVDLRYTADLAYTYGGFNTLRLGVFYAFGR